jgi:hypothetical protein
MRSVQHRLVPKPPSKTLDIRANLKFINTKLLLLLFLACGVTLPDRFVHASIILMIDGNSSSSAMAGTYTDSDGNEQTSTAAQVTRVETYVKRYDGKTTFSLDYMIFFKDGVLDSQKSTVKFLTKTYTSSGKEQKSNWMSTLIPIASVVVKPGTTEVLKFSFDHTDWYPGNRFLAESIVGMIDLEKNMSTYLATYQSKSTGVISKYNVTGTEPAPNPNPPPLPAEFGNPEIFTPIPEPATLVLFLASLSLIFRRESMGSDRWGQ